MGALRRFIFTCVGVAALMLVAVVFRAPSGFDWRDVSPTSWLSGLGIVLASGCFVALVELLANRFGPRRGKLGRREKWSVWDHINIP